VRGCFDLVTFGSVTGKLGRPVAHEIGAIGRTNPRALEPASHLRISGFLTMYIQSIPLGNLSEITIYQIRY
jgi:hypothetical protein